MKTTQISVLDQLESVLSAPVKRRSRIRILYKPEQKQRSRRIVEPIKIDGCLLLAFCYQAGGFRKFSTDCIESLEVLDAYCTKLKDDDNDDVEGSNEDIQNNDKNIQNNKDANEDSQRDDIDELAFRMISIYRNVHREDGKANTIIDMALAEIMADCYEESKEYLSLDDFGKLIKLRSKFNIDIK